MIPREKKSRDFPEHISLVVMVHFFINKQFYAHSFDFA
jgi:hypothetical protein